MRCLLNCHMSLSTWDGEVLALSAMRFWPTATGVNPIMVEVDGPDFVKVSKREMTLYVYGFVDYFDVVGNPHQTRFCNLFWPSLPDDPNQESFILAGNTPASYTHCT